MGAGLCPAAAAAHKCGGWAPAAETRYTRPVDAKTAGGILVRRVRFEYPADLEPHWNRASPEWSQVVNACSLLMPYLEPYLIASIRAAMAEIDGSAPALGGG